jgi:signal transduction histidine kinase/CheY-like chemotaxis protein
MESTHESILIADKIGNIQYFNKKLITCFKLEPSALSTLKVFCENMRTYNAESDNLYESINKYLMDDKSDSLTVQFNFSSSKEELQYYVLIVTKIQREELHSIPAYLFEFRDRSGEEKVLQMKNELINIVSHELKTPLSSILGFVEILLYREVSLDKRKKYYQTIHNEAIRLSNLINDFLDLQRMEAGQQKYYITPLGLDTLLVEIVEQWTEKQGSHIQLQLQAKAIFVRADENRLRQVLNHLINNAFKYSPDNENIQIIVELNQKNVCIHVQDRGIGIPEEAKSKLFNKFYRVDNSDRRQMGGTGLGLTICKEIVEKLGGHLTFTSVLGEGSIFSVELPAYEIVDLHKKLVIVRDNDTIAQFILSSITKLNLPYVHFDTPEECILALEHCNPEKRPSMIFLDLNLQGLNSGWGILDKLHEISGLIEVPVIIFRSLESFGNSNEFEIIAQLIKTIDTQAIADTLSYMMNKVHQHTFLFSERDVSIVPSLVLRGMNIKSVNAKPTYLEIELIPKETFSEI